MSTCKSLTVQNSQKMVSTGKRIRILSVNEKIPENQVQFNTRQYFIHSEKKKQKNKKKKKQNKKNKKKKTCRLQHSFSWH